MVSMDSPDELYTLRTQYYLGHYNLCLEEAKALSRRPLSTEAKIEREEFQLRAMTLLKLYDKVATAAKSNVSPGELTIFNSSFT
jgi:coatomer protein complex subunit epsilon